MNKRAICDISAKRIPLKGGDEYDFFTGWRYVVPWHYRERRRIRRGYHKRFRKLIKAELEKIKAET